MIASEQLEGPLSGFMNSVNVLDFSLSPVLFCYSYFVAFVRDTLEFNEEPHHNAKRGRGLLLSDSRRSRHEGTSLCNYYTLQNGCVAPQGELLWCTMPKNKRVNSECTHSIVMKDMCAQCGKDLREKHGTAGQRVEAATASVSMVHHVPELHVSNDLAKELGDKDRRNVLSQRKLVLLVDLDQTIIHTTNQPYDGPRSEDVFDYKIANCRYFTKIRPHCRQFLENVSKYYEMHVVTFGQRQYAHLIANRIDPEQRFFGQRIMSRDELFHNFQKTQNLKALFPCGEELIAIIDDRRDVWEDMDNLVQVKPYKFFRDVGDINAPGARKNAELKPADGEEKPSTSGEANGEQKKVEEKQAEESDKTLEFVERVLVKAHERFYAHYEAKNEVLDMKNVIADIRREVLCGVCVVLSGVVPQGEDPRKSSIYQLLIRFGADIQEQVTRDTTVVIGARWGTTKIHKAHRENIPVVTPRWLDAVVEQWIKPPFEDFILSKDTAEDKPNRIHPHMRTGSFAQMETLKKDELKSMNDEVDEALSDEDDDDGAEENGDGEEEPKVENDELLGTLEETVDDDIDKYSDEDSRQTDDDDFAEPQQKRRKDEDKEEDGESDAEKDEWSNDSFGDDGNANDDEDDEDDDMAADLEQQFFS
uniref:RNA polymerase II subunit A C-terminal domain phosphatase n=1 Tax=Steinernema glaseri TaxID=37863 RepID=A0A1I7YMY1_9BILA